MNHFKLKVDVTWTPDTTRDVGSRAQIFDGRFFQHSVGRIPEKRKRKMYIMTLIV